MIILNVVGYLVIAFIAGGTMNVVCDRLDGDWRSNESAEMVLTAFFGLFWVITVPIALAIIVLIVGIKFSTDKISVLVEKIVDRYHRSR
jgi:uncharacterized BrkB/YihY/UPF0761 family membrane protein